MKIIQKSLLVSLLIITGLVVFSVISFLLKDWYLFGGSSFLGLVTLYLTIFRVKDVFIAIPSSIFVGRIRGLDENSFSIPIGKPYKEGIHLKPFWWRLTFESRSVKQLKIDKQEYQVGSGGTVLVSGLVQYRVSDVTGYRVAEIGQQEVVDGISSEVDQIIIKCLGRILSADDVAKGDGGALEGETKMSLDIEASGEVNVFSGIDIAIQSKAKLNIELEVQFGKMELDSQGRTRRLFAHDVAYAEQSYGVEILKARIDKIDPIDEIKKSRDNIQVERYEVRSEKIQIAHFANRVEETKDKLGIETERAIEIVMLNMKLTTKDIKQFQVDGVAGLATLVESFLKNKGGKL
ncbi:MAG: hypothetical protein U9O20_01405 [Patescibacteria group bacterium]|nr:hypothetical protein [Patescibacteria group bacterium]